MVRKRLGGWNPGMRTALDSRRSRGRAATPLRRADRDVDTTRAGAWRFPLAVSLVSIGLATSGVAFAAGAESSSWRPAIGIFGALDTTEVVGSVSSTPTARPADRDEVVFVNPNFGFSAALESPGVELPGAELRWWGHAEVGFDVGFRRDIAKEGDPGAFLFPEPPASFMGSLTFQASEVAGRGSRTRGEIEPVVLLAGTGVAIGVDVWKRRLLLKPSIEYRRDTVVLEGALSEVTGVRTLSSDGTTVTVDEDFRQISLAAQRQKTFHSVGFGLELELETGRSGPWLVSLYAGTRAWNVLTGRSIEVSNACCSGTGPEESATWRFERDRWTVSSRVGVRMRWAPLRRRSTPPAPSRPPTGR